MSEPKKPRANDAISAIAAVGEELNGLSDHLDLPTLGELWAYSARHRDQRVIRCRCGCVTDTWTGDRSWCDSHRPRRMGPLPECVEDDLCHQIRD